jgi:hypothetical protein
MAFVSDGRLMPITDFLGDLKFDPEARRVMGLAFGSCLSLIVVVELFHFLQIGHSILD